jgi:hypothetical protein
VAQELGLDDWYLQALSFGCYTKYLEKYYAHLRPENIKIMFYEDLRDDTPGFMIELSRFLKIDDSCWGAFDFWKANVTFSARSRWVHRLALIANRVTEPVLRRRPKLKRAVVNVYKKFNLSRDGYASMTPGVESELYDFYAESITGLFGLTKCRPPESWLQGLAARERLRDERA